MSREFLAHDKTGFYDLVVDFPDQVARTVEICRAVTLPGPNSNISNGFLIGMGGSAAGGDFVRALFDTESTLPFAVSRDYAIPNWVSPSSVGFVASYSGNTEETLEAYRRSKQAGAKLIVVTSGGQLLDLAKQDGFPAIIVPGGQAPRTALGYMLVPMVMAAESMGLISKVDWAEVDRVLRDVLGENKVEVDPSAARKLASTLKDSTPAVYGQGPLTGAVANRWRGQINENAKAMCLTHVFPELCHNEILGWEGASKQGRWSVVVLETGDESVRMTARVAETLELMSTPFTRIKAKGKGPLAKMLSLAYFGDFVSIYLAELMGQDPAQMIAIDELKVRLSKIKS